MSPVKLGGNIQQKSTYFTLGYEVTWINCYIHCQHELNQSETEIFKFAGLGLYSILYEYVQIEMGNVG